MKALARLLKSNIRLLVSAVIVIAVLVGAGSAYARFLSKSTQYSSVSSPAFYFESDFLRVGGKSYSVSAGTTSVSFILSNYEDDLRFAEDSVSYTVTASGGTLSSASGTLAGGAKSSVTVTLSDLVAGQTYTVTATASAGYEKTISASFTVEEPANKLYMNTDATDPSFVLLTVWSQDISGSVTVEFPAGLIPDNTDPVMAGVDNYVAGEYVAGDFSDATSFASSYSSHVYRFFKTPAYDGATPFAAVMEDGGSGIAAEEKPLS